MRTDIIVRLMRSNSKGELEKKKPDGTRRKKISSLRNGSVI
jgi:hypothetical protein